MKPHLITTIFCLAFTSLLLGQTQDIVDAEKKITAALSLSDNDEKLNLLFSDFEFLLRHNIPLAKEVVDSSLEIALRINHRLAFVRHIYMKGSIDFFEGRLDSAEICYNRALEKLQELREKRETKVLEGEIRARLGDVYNFQLGKLDLGLEQHLLALDLFEENAAEEQKKILYERLGIDYLYRDEYDKAIDYFLTYLDDYRQEENWERVGTLLGRISNAYTDMENYEAALVYNDSAMVILNKMNAPYGMAGTALSLIAILNNAGRYTEAYKSIPKARKLIEDNNFTVMMPGLNYFRGSLEAKVGDPQKAVEILSQVIATSDTLKATWAYFGISKAYKRMRAFELALENYEIYATNIIKDEEKKRNDQFNELLVKHETEQKEQEIVFLKKEAVQMQQTKVLFIVSTIMFLLAGLLYYSRYRIQKKLVIEREANHKEIMNIKERTLTKMTLLNQQQNDFVVNLKSDIQALVSTNGSLHNEIDKIVRKIDRENNQDEYWGQFLQHFEQVHPRFFKTLTMRYDKLTPLDLKHCAFIRLNLSNKEVANMLNVNAKSVQISRYRLKKKLNLETEQCMNEFLAML